MSYHLLLSKLQANFEFQLNKRHRLASLNRLEVLEDYRTAVAKTLEEMPSALPNTGPSHGYPLAAVQTPVVATGVLVPFVSTGDTKR